MNKGRWLKDIFGVCILIIVVINLIEVKMEEVLVRWREKIVKLMDFLVCVILLERGG